MKNKLSLALRTFFTPEAMLPFFVGAVGLGVLTNAVYQALTNWLGNDTPAVTGIALVSLVLLIGAIWILGVLIDRMRLIPQVIFRQAAPSPRRGLIVMVSRRDPALEAIRHHVSRLERLWLVCSVDTFALAEEIRAQFPNLCPQGPSVVRDVLDPMEFHRRIDEILMHLPNGWNVRDVIADYAGMTSHGSVGMVIACLQRGCALQYTPAKFDSQLKPLRPLPPIEIQLDFQVRSAIAAPPIGDRSHQPEQKTPST